MNMKSPMTKLLLPFICLSLYSALGAGQDAPRYKVDAEWPQVLPYKFAIGMINGLAVGPDDSIWVLHDPYNMQDDEIGASLSPPRAECCFPAPQVLQFDRAGKLLRAWHGKDRISTWPVAAHGIGVDKQGNVWIAGVGFEWHPDLPGFSMAWDSHGNRLEGQEDTIRDRQVLKLSPTGKLLLQIGQPSYAHQNNQDTSILGAPTAMAFDDAANEVFIADGAMNKRVVVYDMNTGEFKRGWGAYGISLDKIDNADPWAKELPTGRIVDASVAPPKQFRILTDIAISDDGIVYVTDQMNNRIQAFTRQGEFVKEIFVAPKTGGNGAAWGLAVSRDRQQKYLFVADGNSGVIRIIDRRSGTEVGKVGTKGRNAGELVTPSFVAFDSKGALYTAEHHFSRSWDGWQATFTGRAGTPGGRLQRFVPEK